MRILKQLTRKKNAFFRGIKFNLINYRYRNKPARKAFDPAAVRRVLLLRLDDKVGDMVVTTGCARILAERGISGFGVNRTNMLRNISRLRIHSASIFISAAHVLKYVAGGRF